MEALKRNNLHIIVVPERGEREINYQKAYLQQNFTNLGRHWDIQVNKNHM